MAHLVGGNKLIDPVFIFDKVGLEGGMKIADFGCGGAGHFIIPAAERIGSAGIAYAVDIQKIVLEGIENKAKISGVKNIKTIWSNLEIYKATKIPDNELDIGLLINTLFQTKKHLEMINECVRMIKSTGKLLAVDWKNIPVAFGPAQEDRITKDDLKKIALEKAGLLLIDEFDAGHYHYGLIFQKKA
ncbi:MAG: methyltransferase domain-containing protein [bacterium]